MLLLQLAATGPVQAHESWSPMEIDDKKAVVPVAIGEIRASATIGSMNEVSRIDDRFARENPNLRPGPDVLVVEPFALEEAPSIKKLPVDVADVPLRLRNVARWPIETHKIELALSAFDGHVLQLDYPSRRFRILDRDAADLGRTANIPAANAAGTKRLMVGVGLPGEAALQLLLAPDVPYGVLVERRIAEARGWLSRYPLTRQRYAGGLVDEFVLPELRIGPFVLENVLAATPAPGQADNVGRNFNGRMDRLGPDRSAFSRYIAPAYRGHLGFDVLQHFVVTLDRQRARLHLGPTANMSPFPE